MSRWLFRGGGGEIGGGCGRGEGRCEGVGGVRELARYVRPTLAKVASDPRPRGSRRVVIGTLQLAVHLLAVHAEPAAFEEDPTRVAQADGLRLVRSGPPFPPHGGILSSEVRPRGFNILVILVFWYFVWFWVCWLLKVGSFWASGRRRGTERVRVGDAGGRYGTYSAGARRIGAHQPHRSAVVARGPAGRVPGKRRFSSGFENPASRGACPRPRSLRTGARAPRDVRERCVPRGGRADPGGCVGKGRAMKVG